MATHEPTVEPRLVLGPDDDGRLTSAGEFAEAEFQEPWNYERSGGSLVVMAPDGQRHIDSASPWWRRLFAYLLAHPEIVEDVVPNAWVRVDGGTDRIGDIGVYLDEGRARTTDSRPRSRDHVRVRQPGAGISGAGLRQEAGRVLQARHPRVCHRRSCCSESDRLLSRPGRYHKRLLRAGTSYTSPLLPGLAIPLADVLGG